MKKILLVLGVMLLTGCGNKVTCVINTDEEFYKTEQKIVFEVGKNDKVTNAIVNHTMIFETEEEAENYFGVLETFEEDYEIKLNKNKIEMSSSKNYEEFDGDKNKLKKEFEDNGYKCK